MSDGALIMSEQNNGKNVSRRDALKIMAASGVGLAMSGPILTACKDGSKQQAGKTSASERSVMEPGKAIAQNSWSSLGGDKVGLLSMGCMRFPNKPGGRELDQEAVNEMIDTCLANGINYFDTAPAYGQSEVVTGNALCRHPRESYYLATKLSNFGSTSFEDGKKMFESSLEKLHTDYIDYLLLHAIGDWNSFNRRYIDNGLLDWLKEQKAAGRIRHLGFSFHGDTAFFDDMIDRKEEYGWEFVQIQLCYLDWGDGNEDNQTRHIYRKLIEAGLPAVIMEPLRGGTLANVNSSLRAMLADAHPELSPAGMALSFVGTLPGMLTILSGMSNMDQLTENIATFQDFKPLSDSDMKLLEEVARLYHENPTIGCTACKYCMPCPYGIDIPGNFILYDNCSSDLDLPNPDGPHDKEYQRKRRIFLNRYQGRLEERERAEFCIGCSSCVEICPQRIDIPRQMKNIENLVTKLRKD